MDKPEMPVKVLNADLGIQIPPELAVHVTPNRIIANFARYPEMQTQIHSARRIHKVPSYS